MSKHVGLRNTRTINILNTGPLTDAYRDGWERTFAKKKRRPRMVDVGDAPASGPASLRERVDELRAAAMRSKSGDNARDLERQADALEAEARRSGEWDG